MTFNILNLHVYSAKGSLESTISIDDLIEIGKQTGVVSLMDSGMFAVIDFYRKCVDNNIKPIIGQDMAFAWGQRAEDLMMMYNTVYYRNSLIAVNEIGYKNLVNLSTYSYLKGLYQKPRIDWTILKERNEGLLYLINSSESDIAMHLKAQSPMANKVMDQILEIFKGRVYLELMSCDINSSIHKFCKDRNIPILPSNKAVFKTTEDYDSYIMSWSINNNKDGKECPYHVSNHVLSLKELDDMGFEDDDIMNLYQFADRIGDYGLHRSDMILPSMGMTDEEFTIMLERKMEEKGVNSQEYKDRLQYELNTILKFGYVDYFLIVKDIIDYCNRELSGYISAGRGSVGGCFVAFLLGITRIDPVHPEGFGSSIPFDRFLNSGRKVMPDIDMDFLPDDRPKIIQYIKDKYGNNSVKNIVVIMTLGVRASVREVARITGFLTPEIDNIIKSFPNDQQLTLDMVKDSDIYKQNMNNHVFMEIFKKAESLEGIPKAYGVHASGIALSNSSMEDRIPFFIQNDREISQYDQDQLDYMGVVKLDILGLNTLQIMNECLDLIGVKEQYNTTKTEFLSLLPLKKTEVYDFINRGEIAGVFQWDTHNYKTVIKRVQPQNFAELVDLNTLGRSASLISGLTDKYIKRRKGDEAVKPLQPELKGLMPDTYELPLYQEQIMSIFVRLANYSLAEADDVRKAIGKKIPELLEKQKKIFIERMGIEKEQVAIEIWEIIDKFSKYTWNFGHALSYTRLCYETAYLARFFPAEYYSACINNSHESFEVGTFLSAIKKLNIKVLPVDINGSQARYTVVNGQVLSGFMGLKYLSSKTIDGLLEARGEGFENFADFNKKVTKKLINKTALISLYCAGAFNSMINTDSEMINLFCERAGIKQKEELYKMELDQYRRSGKITHDMFESQDIRLLNTQKIITIYAYVSNIREIYTKTGKKMAFLTCDNYSHGRYEIVAFPEAWTKNKLSVGDYCAMTIEYRNGLVLNSTDVLSDKEVSSKQ
jgi:DNA polymerase-3 subunit alpha